MIRNPDVSGRDIRAAVTGLEIEPAVPKMSSVMSNWIKVVEKAGAVGPGETAKALVVAWYVDVKPRLSVAKRSGKVPRSCTYMTW